MLSSASVSLLIILPDKSTAWRNRLSVFFNPTAPKSHFLQFLSSSSNKELRQITDKGSIPAPLFLACILLIFREQNISFWTYSSLFPGHAEIQSPGCWISQTSPDGGGKHADKVITICKWQVTNTSTMRNLLTLQRTAFWIITYGRRKQYKEFNQKQCLEDIAQLYE